MDLYLLNIIINTIWYIFTIIFVLYRFTSFFNYIYNYIKFSLKIINGINSVFYKCYTYIKYPNYTDLESQTPIQPTFFQKCKNYIKSFWYKSKTQSTNNNNNSSNTNVYYIQTDNIDNINRKRMETELFNKNFNELYNQDINTLSNIVEDETGTSIELNLLQSSTINKETIDKNNYDSRYFNTLENPFDIKKIPFNTNSKLFYSINLHDTSSSNIEDYKINNSIETPIKEDEVLHTNNYSENFINTENIIDTQIDNLIYNENTITNNTTNNVINYIPMYHSDTHSDTHSYTHSDTHSEHSNNSRLFLNNKKCIYDEYILKNPYI